MIRSFFLDQRHRRDIPLSSAQHIVDSRQSTSTREDDDGPVEVHGSSCIADTGRQREEREDKAHEKESQRDVVDKAAPLA